MTELISQILTPELQMVLIVLLVMLIALYVLSIVWVIRDANQRGVTWWVWGLVSLIPIVGVIAYCLMRPPLMQIDRDEQELEVALKQRELMKYGECAHCGYPVEEDYVMSNLPSCAQPILDRMSLLHHPYWSASPAASSSSGTAWCRCTPSG